MNAHGEMSGSSDKFIGKQFLSDMEAYNFYNSFARNRDFSVRRKGTDKSRKPPYEIICRKFCCNKEGVKKLSDKRQEGLTVHRRVDTRVACPAEMHIRLRFFLDKRHWVITKFVDTHSHELSSPDKVHHHYSHQNHRSKISRSIMSNLVDVGMRPSNISRVVNAMSQGEGCEEVSPQQVIYFFCLNIRWRWQITFKNWFLLSRFSRFWLLFRRDVSFIICMASFISFFFFLYPYPLHSSLCRPPELPMLSLPSRVARILLLLFLLHYSLHLTYSYLHLR